MAHQNNGARLQVAYVMQTRRKRLVFDYVEVDADWSKSQVMESLRTMYFAQVHNATTTGFQRMVLCQAMVIEIRNMNEVVFDDGEAQDLPARVFMSPGAVDAALTEAFNHRINTTKRAFRNIYPDLVTAAGFPRLTSETKVLFLRKSFDKKRAVVLQLVVLLIMVIIGVAVGIVKQSAELGAAIGGALFALAACVQASLFWFYR